MRRLSVRFIWRGFVCCGLVWYVLMSSAAAQVVPARYLLTGTLKGERVQLELILSPTEVSGTLLGTPPRTLKGKRTKNKLSLTGAGVNLEGTLPSFRTKNQAFSGTLTGGTPFSLALAASYTVRRVTQGPFLETHSETPFWLVAPWRQLNGRLRQFVNAPVSSFVRDAQQLAAAGELTYPYTYESTVNLTLLTHDTLSLLETSFYDTGGAHPNTACRSLNFYGTGKAVKRLGLGDLFRESAAYQPVLLQEVTKKLRARRAAWILDGSVKLKMRDLGVFNLTERGLMVTFAPYAVGPYAQGKFAVTVPYKELETLLKPGLLP